MDLYPRSHLRAALVLAMFLAIMITALPAKETPHQRVPVSLAVQPKPLQLSPAATGQQPDEEEQAGPVSLDASWQQVRIKSGDNLSSIFKRVGLPAADLVKIANLGNEADTLRKIIPGRSIDFQIVDGVLESLKYEKTHLETIVFNRQGDSFTAHRVIQKPEVLTSFRSGRITDSAPSLYMAGKKAGLSDNIIMKLANIFQWDISFALDLRTGDSFTLLYEDVYIDGEKAKEGDILAAEFTNMGTTYKAVLYQTAEGRKSYYAPDGRSMRKAFLRDPVHFKYVSSRFNLHRFHPIKKRIMPHRGIDYAANRGTPVVASGDGTVTIARRNNASGNYIVIQHGQQYTTKYLHLSKFAHGIRPGRHVSQGQTIGYVGATGWATAPHLHYEFLVNGVHRNPRTVALPKADPIPGKEFDRFKASVAPMLARLDSIAGNTNYAYAPEAEQTPAD